MDNEIDKRYKELQYLRYVDDYFIFVKDATRIQEVVACVRKNLMEYELVLNESKLQITESPFSFDNPWIEELKFSIHRGGELLLDKAIVLYNEYKDITIFKYALKAIYLNNINPKSWDRMESKLYNLWIRFPALSELIIKLLLQKKEEIHMNRLKKVIYSNLEKCKLLNLQQEQIWIVWAIRLFEVKVKQEYVIEILKSNNDLAILIILDCISAGIIDRTQSISKQLDMLRNELNALDISDKGESGQLMWTSRWLLAYECQLHKWLDSQTDKFEAVNNDRFYKSLLKEGIDFYDSSYVTTEVQLAQATRKKTQSLIEYMKQFAKCNEDKKEISSEKQNELSQSIIKIIQDSEGY